VPADDTYYVSDTQTIDLTTTITVEGTLEIRTDGTLQNGGTIFVDGGTILVTDGTLKNGWHYTETGTVYPSNGTIELYDNATLHMNGGTLINSPNDEDDIIGIIYNTPSHNATINLDSGTLVNAQGHHGIIYLTQGTLIINSGNLTIGTGISHIRFSLSPITSDITSGTMTTTQIVSLDTDFTLHIEENGELIANSFAIFENGSTFINDNLATFNDVMICNPGYTITNNGILTNNGPVI